MIRVMKWILLTIFIFGAFTSEESNDGNGLIINLISHAQTNEELNEKFKWKDKKDRLEFFKWGLNEVGLANAEKLGEHLKNKYHKMSKTTLIYTSPFRHCIQTALPIAKALKAKLRIDYGLFEPFRGFPTKQEIEEFYKDNEDYIDETYQSQFVHDIVHYLKPDGFQNRYFLYYSTQNVNCKFTRDEIYENELKMANYLREVQQKENVNIIVVSHQHKMNEIGLFLENPKRTTKNNSFPNKKYSVKDLEIIMKKWDYGRVIEFENIKKKELYGLGKEVNKYQEIIYHKKLRIKCPNIFQKNVSKIDEIEAETHKVDDSTDKIADSESVEIQLKEQESKKKEKNTFKKYFSRFRPQFQRESEKKEKNTEKKIVSRRIFIKSM